MRIRYLAVARAEIAEAAEYYAAISPPLGVQFKRELRRMIRWAASLPNELLVLAIGHQHRKPDDWRDRLAMLE